MVKKEKKFYFKTVSKGKHMTPTRRKNIAIFSVILPALDPFIDLKSKQINQNLVTIRKIYDQSK